MTEKFTKVSILSPKNQIHSGFYFAEEKGTQFAGHELRHDRDAPGNQAEDSILHRTTLLLKMHFQGMESTEAEWSQAPPGRFESAFSKGKFF